MHGRHSPPFSILLVHKQPACCRRLPAPLPPSQTRSRTPPSSDLPRHPPVVTAHAGIGTATVATPPSRVGGLGRRRWHDGELTDLRDKLHAVLSHPCARQSRCQSGHFVEHHAVRCDSSFSWPLPTRARVQTVAPSCLHVAHRHYPPIPRCRPLASHSPDMVYRAPRDTV
jgi:hypothetical protein